MRGKIECWPNSLFFKNPFSFFAKIGPDCIFFWCSINEWNLLGLFSIHSFFFCQSVKLLYNKRKLLYCVKFCFLFLKNRVNRASWEREILDETESSGTLEIAPFNASTYLNTPKPWLLRAPKMHKNAKKRIAADKRIKRARLIEFRTLS